MNQMARGLEDTVGTEALRQLERLKWFLWDGNVLRALQVVGDLEIDLDVDVDNLGPSRPAQAGEDDDRVRPLHRGQRRVDPELRGALPLWRGDLERLRRVGGQSGREQAHGEESADALVAAKRTPPAPDPYPGAQRRPGRRLPPLVPSLHAGVGTTGRGSVNSHSLSRSPKWEAFTLCFVWLMYLSRPVS